MFIINGENAGLDTLLPPDAENIKVVRRNNSCYDVGSYGEALKGLGDSIKQYKRFILLNASIRGPFIPHWSKECWSDAYLGRLTDQVKVGDPTSMDEMPDLHMWLTGACVACRYDLQLRALRQTRAIYDPRNRQYRSRSPP